MLCGGDNRSEGNFSQLIEDRVSQIELDPKERKLILRQAERFGRLRNKPSFVGESEALAAQQFAESIVMFLLVRDAQHADSSLRKLHDDQA